MHKTTLYIPDDQVRALRGRAMRTGKTLTDLIREALSVFLKGRSAGEMPKQFMSARGSAKKRNRFGDSVGFQRALREEWDAGGDSP